ncbi:uncharacterized protein KD926_010453 [Aspergillus affinis]|uniref:uncharacterized protein n=1 Tax=Aspergillus affinis TaxID=1070780 RepID=UPI0022FF38D9|nr:uncharacterized protein KD926_010453 [Aspergillus affinis]KAI9038718.1 hypothetical protein KD926_010453 [Aspergillus affinis]
MHLTSIVIATLLATAEAVLIIKPAAGDNVDVSKNWEVDWSAVDTDPPQFCLYLTNFIDYPPQIFPLLNQQPVQRDAHSATIPGSCYPGLRTSAQPGLRRCPAPLTLVHVPAGLPAIPPRAPIRRVLVARPFLQGAVEAIQASLHGTGVCVHRAVVERGIHRVQQRQRCALNAGSGRAGVRRIRQRGAFRGERGKGQRGGEGEHADNGDGELYRGLRWLETAESLAFYTTSRKERSVYIRETILPSTPPWVPASGGLITVLGPRLDEQDFDEEERWRGR